MLNMFFSPASAAGMAARILAASSTVPATSVALTSQRVPS